ncbi:hypothetical protein ABZW18_17785 [Streptomyces sp. NPDC004647]|uniref:hypothetical protein n=1 Tax=Streptomyces sp. NPDC004647 TaxID=3154671 RepID=UPI00339DF183
MSDEPTENEPVFRCRVVAQTTDALRAFIDEVRPDTGCRAVARDSGEGVGIDLYLHQSQLDLARTARSASSVTITSVENTTENWLARKEEVGGGNRFAARGAVPRGLGRKE